MSRGTRRALFALALLLVLGGGAVTLLPRMLWGDSADYSHVVSIESVPEYQSASLLDKAFQLPVAAAYRKGGLEFQRNPSFCGPTSVVNVARSLGTPLEQTNVLDGTPVSTTFGIVWGGVTLDRLAEVVTARLGKRVTVLRGLDLAQFREELKHANDPGRRYIANFSRGPIFGRGGGHHSPIGGYLAGEDLVLMLDVNKHFRPWLAKSERVWEAVNTVDRQTGKPRGLLRIE